MPDRTTDDSRNGPAFIRLKSPVASVSPQPKSYRRAKQQKEQKQQRHQQSEQIPHQDPIETDPDYVRCLWDKVAGKHDSSICDIPMRSRQPDRRSPTSNDMLRPQVDRSRSITSGPTAITPVSSSLTTSTAPGPGTSDFRSFVLDRFGISFEDALMVGSPYEYFRTEDPEDQVSSLQIIEWYQDHCPFTSIWLDLDERTARAQTMQYKHMTDTRENSAKFVYRGKQYFLKENESCPSPNDDEYGDPFLALDQHVNIDGKQISCPPALSPTLFSHSDCSFARSPDCSYWLSLQNFDAAFRHQIEYLTHVLPGSQATAPYLTVEFQTDNAQTSQTCEDQLACSATLLLYNRFLLRKRRLEECGRPITSWKPTDFKDIAHYGISFSGSVASVHVIRPCLQFDKPSSPSTNDPSFDFSPCYPWRGVRVIKLDRCRLTVLAQFLDLRRWINEIHRWALQSHKESVALDIKAILMFHNKGSRIITLTEEEKNKLDIRDDDDRSRRKGSSMISLRTSKA